MRRGRHCGHPGASPDWRRHDHPANRHPARLVRRARHPDRPGANPDPRRHDHPANRHPARLIRRGRHPDRPGEIRDRSRHDRSANRRPSRFGRRARPGRTRGHCPRRPGRSSADGPGRCRCPRGRCAAGGGRRAGIPARAAGRLGPSHPAPTSRGHPRRPACGRPSCAPRSSRPAGRRTTRHGVPVHAVTPRAGRGPIRAAGRPRSEHRRPIRFRCVPGRHPTHRGARDGRRLLVGSRRHATPRGPDGGVRVGPHAPGGRRDDLAAGGCRQNHPRYSPTQDT
jgi:hypothetical protein